MYTINNAIATHLARKINFKVIYTHEHIVLISDLGGTFYYNFDGTLVED